MNLACEVKLVSEESLEKHWFRIMIVFYLHILTMLVGEVLRTIFISMMIGEQIGAVTQCSLKMIKL